MKVYLLVLATLALCMSLSCASDRSIEDIQSVESPIKSLNKLNDSTFFTDGVDELAFYQDVGIIVDNKQGSTFIVDKDFNVRHVLKHGEGPDQILYSYSAIVNSEGIHFSDYGKMTFTSFSHNGELQRTLKSPYTDFFGFLHQFGINEGGDVVSSTNLAEKPIFILNSDTSIIAEFGDWLDYENENHKRSINNKHLLMTSGGDILNIYVTKPLIERYDDRGNLLSTLDLGDFLSFRTKKYEEILEENPGFRDRLSFTYYNDVYLYGDKLYLLFIGDYEIPNSNQVAIIDITSKKMSVEKVIKLNVDGAFFKEIAISDNYIWAFDKAAAEFIQFSL